MNTNGHLTPKEIVEHLDKHIIGQGDAKKAVAIALRNRWRRQQVPDDLRSEIMPNNIIMIGPTGVGKTEIARRLADLAGAPFLKVEASKFTEVGYVGRDVDSMVRDLVDIGVNMVKEEQAEIHEKRAQQLATERLIDLVFKTKHVEETIGFGLTEGKPTSEDRSALRQMVKEGKLDDEIVEIEAPQTQFPVLEIFSPMGMEELGVNFQEVFSGLMPKKTKKRKMTVKEARKFIIGEEITKLVNMDEVIGEALERVQEVGIVFIDEIDKIVGDHSKVGPDVSREGVQRDILPIIEGSGVMTKYGMVYTDHVLFIAAGAFHNARPSDLIPELQGRFPIRVELNSLTAEDFARILVEPKSALVKQYIALMATEGVTMEFTPEAINRIAALAEQVNSETENIGARRLHTIMTRLLEEYMFEPPVKKKKLTITAALVDKRLHGIIENEDLSRYIL